MGAIFTLQLAGDDSSVLSLCLAKASRGHSLYSLSSFLKPEGTIFFPERVSSSRSSTVMLNSVSYLPEERFYIHLVPQFLSLVPWFLRLVTRFLWLQPRALEAKRGLHS